MTRSLAKSNAHFKNAIRRLPLGVSSNFRYWGEDKTIYVKSGKGARVTDIDGNEYIDYRLGYGPCILGYADPRVDAAARAGQEVGGVFALSTERELAVAERIAKMVPAAELVRFSNSGTEAVMAALRVARVAGPPGLNQLELLPLARPARLKQARTGLPLLALRPSIGAVTTMTSRQRVCAALHHQPPDRVPLDLGSTPVTGIHVSTYTRLRTALGFPPARVHGNVTEFGHRRPLLRCI